MPFDCTIEHFGNVDKVRFIGSMNEEMSDRLAELSQRVGAECVLNFGQVQFVNSMGIRAWIQFIRGFGERRKIVFEECPPDVILQINMIPRFRGNASIATFYGTMVCEDCGRETMQLFQASKGYEALKEEAKRVSCPSCGNCMALEEDVDAFFDFLQTP